MGARKASIRQVILLLHPPTTACAAPNEQQTTQCRVGHEGGLPGTPMEGIPVMPVSIMKFSRSAEVSELAGCGGMAESVDFQGGRH